MFHCHFCTIHKPYFDHIILQMYKNYFLGAPFKNSVVRKISFGLPSHRSLDLAFKFLLEHLSTIPCSDLTQSSLLILVSSDKTYLHFDWSGMKDSDPKKIGPKSSHNAKILFTQKKKDVKPI